MEQPKAKPYIRDLILFRTRQVTPVLFAAWERFSPDDFVRVLKLVSVVSFRYLVSGRNPNALELVYHLAAKAILDGNATRPRAVFTRLRPVYVDDRTFESNFAVFSINARGRKKLLKYILCRLEENAGGIARDPEADPASIEHILPQNPSGDWTEAFSALELEAAVDRIGNATLLESACQPQYRRRTVFGQTSCLRTKRLCADPTSRGDGARGMDLCAHGEAPTASRPTRRAGVALGFRLTGMHALRYSKHELGIQ